MINIKPLKKLGQNFLTDKEVLKKIIQAANLKSDDIVLEIGPGLGILTIELAKKVKRVIAIEKDKRMCKILKKMLDVRNVRNVRIVNQDILKISNFKFQISNFKLVANLPYYITSPVIRKFLESKNKPELMVLMVQKEVAQRIVAKDKKMSVLSVAVQFYAKPKIISYVSKKSFWPVPKVDSAILRIEPRMNTNLRPNEYKSFFKLVKAGFSSKRKFLINNLSRELKIENYKLKIVFDQIGLGQKLRAENLSIQDWLRLFHKSKLG
jgi:16S rRNA (adenine1518-N6/adenine1519-N6)-dimethyltransferase